MYVVQYCTTLYNYAYRDLSCCSLILPSTNEGQNLNLRYIWPAVPASGNSGAPTDGAGAVHYTGAEYGPSKVSGSVRAVLVSLYAVVTETPFLDTQLSRRFRKRIPAVSL